MLKGMREMNEDRRGDAAIRAIRDALREQLARLDALGEKYAAIEVNSAVEILNSRLGEAPSTEEIAKLTRHYFSD